MEGGPYRRCVAIGAALGGSAAAAAVAAATSLRPRRRMRIAILGMTQEVAHQNPVPSTHRDFDISRGNDLLAFGERSYIGGAVRVLSARDADVELVPIYAAGGPSAGVLEHRSFLLMAEELLGRLRLATAEATPGGVDGVYFSMHGAMATSEEADPEGWLLERVRAIVGEQVPITISVDLHGIMTARMLRHVDGLCPLHTCACAVSWPISVQCSCTLSAGVPSHAETTPPSQIHTSTPPTPVHELPRCCCNCWTGRVARLDRGGRRSCACGSHCCAVGTR
jgi:hypothetical protein